jgi:hypothetical protein
MKTELKYLEKKIKKKLIKKNFSKWNKESICLLISIFENSKYKELYDLNLILFDDYINWYKKNTYISDQYSLEKLIDLYCLIKTNTYKNIYISYDKFLENKEEDSKINSFWDIYFYAIFAIIIIFVKFFTYLMFYRKKEEEKNKIFELQIPIPQDILNNPLIKYFIGNNVI